MLPFNEIPQSLRVPGAFIEIDPSQAGLAGELPAVVIVGQKLATGTAPAGELTRISSVKDAEAKGGAGSMLAQMVSSWRENEILMDLYALPLNDLADGAAATGTITLTAPVTEAGVASLYIAARRVQIGFAKDDTPAAQATKIAAAITAAGAEIPAAATASGAVVTLTARHKGTAGNTIDLRLGLYGESVPAGFSANLSAMAGGAGDPDLSEIESMLGGREFWYMALGHTDNAGYAALHTETQRRYAFPAMRGMRVFSAVRGQFEDAASFGEDKNYEHICAVAISTLPTSVWEFGAAHGAATAAKLFNNPVKSAEGTPIKGVVGVKQEYFEGADLTQLNSLLWKGMSIIEVGSDGSCFVKRPISLYQERSDGSADDTYLDIGVAEVMDRIRYEQRNGAVKEFRGTIAAKDKSEYKPGTPVTTADDVRAFLLDLYKETLTYDYAWTQNVAAYKASLLVEQNPNNPNRFDYCDKPIINSPFYILAGRAQFRRKS